jgi:hypothetical protein
MPKSDFRIDYTILRRQPGDEDFSEIGFGSSGDWTEIGAALYQVQSDVQNRSWETSEGMPDPSDVECSDDEEYPS